jgi:hypothetical protein
VTQNQIMPIWNPYKFGSSVIWGMKLSLAKLEMLGANLGKLVGLLNGIGFLFGYGTHTMS